MLKLIQIARFPSGILEAIAFVVVLSGVFSGSEVVVQPAEMTKTAKAVMSFLNIKTLCPIWELWLVENQTVFHLTLIA